MIRLMVVPVGIRSDGVSKPFTTATRSTGIVDGYFVEVRDRHLAVHLHQLDL